MKKSKEKGNKWSFKLLCLNVSSDTLLNKQKETRHSKLYDGKSRMFWSYFYLIYFFTLSSKYIVIDLDKLNLNQNCNDICWYKNLSAAYNI